MAWAEVTARLMPSNSLFDVENYFLFGGWQIQASAGLLSAGLAPNYRHKLDLGAEQLVDLTTALECMHAKGGNP